MTSIRVAAVLLWGVAAGLGLSVILVARYLMAHGELPTVPLLGFRAFGGGFFERFGTVPFIWLSTRNIMELGRSRAFYRVFIQCTPLGWPPDPTISLR